MYNYLVLVILILVGSLMIISLFGYSQNRSGKIFYNLKQGVRLLKVKFKFKMILTGYLLVGIFLLLLIYSSDRSKSLHENESQDDKPDADPVIIVRP